ncbi:MAG: undecaprenyl-diphosphate phosphatase [Patescibacteria group bacterium]
MSIFQAILLGVVQGLTEFLPVSSSAHLILVPYILGWPEFPLVFDTSLHLGTALAVLIYFAKDFLKMDRNMLLKLVLGSVPVVVVGFLFGDVIENVLGGVGGVIIFLLVGSLIMLAAERKALKRKDLRIKNVSVTDSIVIGVAQMFALLPGISRSGVTISAGILRGFSREQAARFSFMLSMPAVVGAGFYQLSKTYQLIGFQIGYVSWIIGIVSSFITGLLVINFLINSLKQNGLMIYVYYRLFLVLLILSLFFKAV